jgi:hypothetical protein
MAESSGMWHQQHCQRVTKHLDEQIASTIKIFQISYILKVLCQGEFSKKKKKNFRL